MAREPSKTAKRYEMFAREWVVDMNGTRSAIAAGYSEKGADTRASQLLGNARVRKLIDRFQSERATRLGVRADRVLEEISRLAFSNMQDLTKVDEDGKAVLDLSNADRDKFASIQEIREDTTGGSGDGERKQVIRTTVKLADKSRNLELLGRHLKLFTDKVEVSGLEGLADILRERRKVLAE